MKDYYKAYEERYKETYKQNILWETTKPTNLALETINKYNINKNDKILDLGCGEGRDAIHLLRQGYDVFASDISPEAISFCKKKVPEYADKFMVLNACESSWDATYDLIYSIAVLHMLVLEEDRNKFLIFVREHLNENGYGLILSMGDGEMEHSSDISNAFDKQERVHVETGTKVCIASTSCKIVSFTTLEREIEGNGLSIVEKGITSIEPGFPVIMYAIVKKK